MVRKKLHKIKKIVIQYVNEIEKYGIHAEKIILFGSYAKGEERDYSDIDLVVISRDLAKWPPLERLQLLSRATANIDAPLEVLGYTPKEIKERGHDSIMWGEISMTGREVYKKAA